MHLGGGKAFGRRLKQISKQKGDLMMEKSLLGIILLFIGIIFYLYNWISLQKQRQRRIEEFWVFLQKAIFAMETEQVKLSSFFMEYPCYDPVFAKTLQEIGSRLKSKTYPKGEVVWQEVFMEEKESWRVGEETFAILITAGKGFFGGSLKENVSFLQRSIQKLEEQERKNRKKELQERKLWVPVGMLGGIMLVIIFI